MKKKKITPAQYVAGCADGADDRTLDGPCYVSHPHVWLAWPLMMIVLTAQRKYASFLFLLEEYIDNQIRMRITLSHPYDHSSSARVFLLARVHVIYLICSSTLTITARLSEVSSVYTSIVQ